MAESLGEYASADDIDERIRALEKEMRAAAKELDFEHAVELRDRIKALRQLLVLEDDFVKGPISALRFIRWRCGVQVRLTPRDWLNWSPTVSLQPDT